MPHAPVRISSSHSRLQQPVRFLREAFRDARASLPVARRLFLSHLEQRYRRSSLGLFWAVVPPLAVCLLLVGGQRLQVGAPDAFFAIYGLLLAQTFLEAVQFHRALFSEYRHLLRRSSFPLEGPLLAAWLCSLFALLIRLPVAAACFLFFAVWPSPEAPLAVLGALGLTTLGAAVGLLLAAPSSLRPELDNFMALFPWLLFAITPIFVPVPALSRTNPLAWVFDSLRHLGYAYPGSLWPAVALLPVAGIAFVLSWLLCRLARPYVAEKALA